MPSDDVVPATGRRIHQQWSHRALIATRATVLEVSMRASLRGTAILSIVMLSVFNSACRSWEPAESARAQAQQLRRAADRLGVPARTERMITVNQGGASFLTAPAANLESVPATELPRGVNVAVAYLDSPGQTYAPGFYALRAFANPQGPGTVEGRLEVVGENQTVVTQLPAQFEILTMTLPDRPERLFANWVLRPTRNTGQSCNADYETCSCCTNGWIVCTPRLWIPRVTALVDALPRR